MCCTARRATPERRAPPPPPEKRAASPISFSIEKRPNPMVPNAQPLKRKKANSPPPAVESSRRGGGATAPAKPHNSGARRAGNEKRSSHSSSSDSSNSSGSDSESSDSGSSDTSANKRAKQGSNKRHDKTASEKKSSSKTSGGFRLVGALRLIAGGYNCNCVSFVALHRIQIGIELEEDDPPRGIVETVAGRGGCYCPETVQTVVILTFFIDVTILYLHIDEKLYEHKITIKCVI